MNKSKYVQADLFFLFSLFKQIWIQHQTFVNDAYIGLSMLPVWYKDRNNSEHSLSLEWRMDALSENVIWDSIFFISEVENVKSRVDLILKSAGSRHCL